MKTYRHLYEEIISEENIKLAIKESCKSRKKSRKKQKKLENLKNNPNAVKIVKGWIEHYETIKRTPKPIYDGIKQKKRMIYVPSVRETVVQHAVVQVLDKYLLKKSIYDHAYAAIKGRGQHKAKKYVERYIRNNPRDVKYYLKMDIKQYFPSVPQDKLITMLKRQVKDTKTIELVQKIIQASDTGIPLGFFISQWFANYYLRDFDHDVKKLVGKDLYIRWMDDMVLFCSNKRKLHQYRERIAQMLCDKGLTLKDNWRIQRFDHSKGGCFLDYMGFRFYRGRTTLRRSIFYKISRKARKMGKKPTIYQIRQFMSYIGWLNASDTYEAYTAWIKPYVNIRQYKKRISQYDKRRVNNEVSARDGHAGNKAA